MVQRLQYACNRLYDLETSTALPPLSTRRRRYQRATLGALSPNKQRLRKVPVAWPPGRSLAQRKTPCQRAGRGSHAEGSNPIDETSGQHKSQGRHSSRERVHLSGGGPSVGAFFRPPRSYGHERGGNRAAASIVPPTAGGLPTSSFHERGRAVRPASSTSRATASGVFPVGLYLLPVGTCHRHRPTVATPLFIGRRRANQRTTVWGA